MTMPRSIPCLVVIVTRYGAPGTNTYDKPDRQIVPCFSLADGRRVIARRVERMQRNGWRFQHTSREAVLASFDTPAPGPPEHLECSVVLERQAWEED
jgi:hypothetical protein